MITTINEFKKLNESFNRYFDEHDSVHNYNVNILNKECINDSENNVELILNVEGMPDLRGRNTRHGDWEEILYFVAKYSVQKTDEFAETIKNLSSNDGIQIINGDQKWSFSIYDIGDFSRGIDVEDEINDDDYIDEDDDDDLDPAGGRGLHSHESKTNETKEKKPEIKLTSAEKEKIKRIFNNIVDAEKEERQYLGHEDELSGFEQTEYDDLQDAIRDLYKRENELTKMLIKKYGDKNATKKAINKYNDQLNGVSESKTNERFGSMAEFTVGCERDEQDSTKMNIQLKIHNKVVASKTMNVRDAKNGTDSYNKLFDLAAAELGYIAEKKINKTK